LFTQDGTVVKEGGTLFDGTIVNDLSPFGKVAISVGTSGDMVAFHGETGTDQTDTDALFTQDGTVVKEGGTLPDGTTVHNIKPEGKVAISLSGEIAFHGKVEVDTQELRAVFTHDGLLVKGGDTLTDGTSVGYIDETGGVAINLSGIVAFHGAILEDNGLVTDSAVFTQDGVVAKQNGTLLDGSIIGSIDEAGGVAINLSGTVAFHGALAPIPGDPVGSVTAVFTQDGVVVKEGDILPDGNIVDEIDPSGGVGIDFSGNVVFHGQTNGVNAVFTQNGLVAAEGWILTDGTTLHKISSAGGVAINIFGEVAFHGKATGVDAVGVNTVFVGTAP
jgi:hypothetical protein